MNRIIINGVEFNVEGSSVSIINGQVIVGGNKIIDIPDTTIRWEGDLASLQCDQSVTCGDVHGELSAKGSVTCGNVNGSVRAGGSVKCDDVGSGITCAGSVKCASVTGKIDAGGSVNCE